MDIRTGAVRDIVRGYRLQRYGMVDVAEEVLDAANILELARDRINRQWPLDSQGYQHELSREFAAVQALIDTLWERLRAIDRMLPDHAKTLEGATKWTGRPKLRAKKGECLDAESRRTTQI